MAGEMRKAIVNLMGNQSWWRNYEILERFESLLPCKSWKETSWTSFKVVHFAVGCWSINPSILWECTLWSSWPNPSRSTLAAQTGKSWTCNQSHSPLQEWKVGQFPNIPNIPSNRHDSGTNHTHTQTFMIYGYLRSIYILYGQIDPLQTLAQIGLRCR